MANKVKVVLDGEGKLVRKCESESENGVWVHENHYQDLKAGIARYVGGKVEVDKAALAAKAAKK